MPKITLSEWDRLMSAGATTYAVGPVTKPEAVFACRAEAEQAAAEGDGTFIQWDGHTGHQFMTPEYESEPEPDGPEFGPRAEADIQLDEFEPEMEAG